MADRADQNPTLNASPTSLIQRFYTDEHIYRQEIAWLREHLWFLVGHESQIPGAGDYFLYDFDCDNVIVIRDRSGVIRAHHNVCRHRGSRICLEPHGSARVLTCPYHAWSYELNGELRTAPFAPDDFDKARYGLMPVHVRVHSGLIFLSFAAHAPAFEAYIDFLSRELTLQDLQHAKVARGDRLAAKANWKLVVQNNLECYHCRPAHPTYSAAHPGIPLGRPTEYDDHARSERLRAALPESEREKNRLFTPVNPDPDTLNFQISSRQLIGEGCATESVGGNPRSPL